MRVLVHCRLFSAALCLTAVALSSGQRAVSSSGPRTSPDLSDGQAGLSAAARLSSPKSAQAGRQAKRDPFPVGEKLTYKVKFIGLSAGYSTVKVLGEGERDGRKTARLEWTVRSSGLVRALIKVDDVARSEVDLATGGVLHFSADKREGGRHTREEFTVEAPVGGGGGVIRSYKRNRKGKEVRKETEYTGPVQDVLSFLYRLRAVEFRLGRHTPMTVFQGHRAYPILFGVNGLERVRVRRIGTFWAFRVQPAAAMPGLFSADGDATLWLEETTRTLLKMVVNTPSGRASMVLVKAENSPLNSAPGSKGGRK